MNWVTTNKQAILSVLFVILAAVQAMQGAAWINPILQVMAVGILEAIISALQAPAAKARANAALKKQAK